MTFLNALVAELFGMFIDDGSLAIAILVWVGAIAALQASGLAPLEMSGPILFLGLGGLLLENVLRRARNR